MARRPVLFCSFLILAACESDEKTTGDSGPHDVAEAARDGSREDAGSVPTDTGAGVQDTGSNPTGGIAAAYPGDEGISGHPSVILVENFDEGSVDTIVQRWTTAGNPDGMTLDADAPAGAADPRSLHVTAVGDQNSGGNLYMRLSEGHDHVFVRYYIKYDADRYHHTTVNVGGFNPPSDFPRGICCVWPDGDKVFSVSMEPVGEIDGGRFPFDFYNYWTEMRRWGDIVNPRPDDQPDPLTGELKTPAAGNHLLRGLGLTITPGVWTAVEVMIKMNDPASRNGELALWIDGENIIEMGEGYPAGSWAGTHFEPDPSAGTSFEGFRWRTDRALQMNYVWVTHYVTGDQPGNTSDVWYDQLVVATEYIGPMAP